MLLFLEICSKYTAYSREYAVTPRVNRAGNRGKHPHFFRRLPDMAW